MLERGLFEAIKPGLLFGELELVAERTALHHLQKACRVSLLDRMKQHLTGEAEVSALAQGVDRFVLRPDLEALSQSVLPDKLHESHSNLLGKPIKLPMDCWWQIIIIRCKESSGSQNPGDLGQGRCRLHPVERLGSSDDISTPIRQASPMSKPISILDVCREGMALDFAYGLFAHVGVGFDPNHPLGPLTPDRGGQSGTAAQIHHQEGCGM